MTTANQTHIWLKQLRSLIGKSKAQRLVMKGLGLKKIGQEITLQDTLAIRGMVEKVHHLIEVQVRPGPCAVKPRSRRKA